MIWRQLTGVILPLLLLACSGPQNWQCPAGTQPDCTPLEAVDDQHVASGIQGSGWHIATNLTSEQVTTNVRGMSGGDQYYGKLHAKRILGVAVPSVPATSTTVQASTTTRWGSFMKTRN